MIEKYWTIFIDIFIVMEKETSWQAGGGFTIANKPKLHFRFHNPNSAAEAASYIVKIFIEVNRAKIDRALQEMADRIEIQSEENRSLSK
ncbi:hypothetical protein AALB16_06845 [Lachnospiraceae bacterium 62-35]